MIFNEGTELVDAVFSGALQICRFTCYESFMMLLDCIMHYAIINS